MNTRSWSRGAATLVMCAFTGAAVVLLPGYWMLFAMDAAGVPSVAKTIRIG